MISLVITPEKEAFDLPVSLPKSYIGKQVHCLFYIEEEAKNVSTSVLPPKKTADFFGTLGYEECEKFEKHIKQIHGEWERNIME